jgi:Zn-dependent protease with chaperone function
MAETMDEAMDEAKPTDPIAAEPAAAEPVAAAEQRVVRVHRARGERRLFPVVLLVALAIWAVLAISVIGLVYALLIGLVLFVMHVVFVAHLRGSAVRLGPEQLPDLYERVGRLARRLGLERRPEAYVMHAGGTLNAMATRFRGAGMIVLYSELIEACGNNTDALDFMIAHELGHLRGGHLRWRWLLLPGLLVPFLGSAYTRGCEYTCDRYGVAVCKSRQRGLEGLLLVAAGPQQAPNLNRRTLARQIEDLDTVWMRIGEWLSTHPPLARRLASLEPALVPAARTASAATRGAVAAIALALLVPAVGGYAAWRYLGAGIVDLGRVEPAAPEPTASARALPPRPASLPERSRPAGPSATGLPSARPPTRASDGAPTVTAKQAPALARQSSDPKRAEAERDIKALADVVEKRRAGGQPLPVGSDGLYMAWAEVHPGQPEPRDPLNGRRYVFVARGTDYLIVSLGRNVDDPADDVVYDSARPPAR